VPSFQVKANCAAEFTQYAMCLEKSSGGLRLPKCRKTQAAFDACMNEKLKMVRPHYGQHTLTKVHQTDRPMPEPSRPSYMDDPRFKKPIGLPPGAADKEDKVYGNPSPWNFTSSF